MFVDFVEQTNRDVCECAYAAALKRNWNREIFDIYAQIQFGTNARGDYKYQFVQNIQRVIYNFRTRRNRQRAARELRVLNL